MSSNSERILSVGGLLSAKSHAVYSSAVTRLLETQGLRAAGQAPLMQVAGLALARLVMAVAPHAQTIWIACGPGNNGGDGFAAASLLQQWGKTPYVSYLENPAQPADAFAARQQAQALGIAIHSDMPQQFDACLDCLFGIGNLRPFDEIHSGWILAMNTASAPVIAADLPSGLNADTGATSGLHVRARYTLSLLTLKPGLFTADGREACGEIWFNDLGVTHEEAPIAKLIGPTNVAPRAHNTHKGSFGDVAILGGATGMTGAAILAASAALHGGAGRVFVGLLDRHAPRWDPCNPELMFRPPESLDKEHMAVVAGCGGSDAIAEHLPDAIRTSAYLVLDADALNHIATSRALRALVAARPANSTVLTPHPLEAARLLASSTAQVQADRIKAAEALADALHATVVLKGSGTIVAAPGHTTAINTSGNGLLASGGTGDVLAGLIGAKLAHGHGAWDAACQAVYQHGAVANHWNPQESGALTASSLSRHW